MAANWSDTLIFKSTGLHLCPPPLTSSLFALTRSYNSLIPRLISFEFMKKSGELFILHAIKAGDKAGGEAKATSNQGLTFRSKQVVACTQRSHSLYGRMQ